MKYTAIIAAILLAGCSSHAEDLERQYQIASDAGDKHAECALASEIARAYLAEENAAEYQSWKASAALDCYNAQFP